MEKNNPEYAGKSYQVVEGPSTLDMIKPYFISMPVGEFPRKKLRVYILGAAVALGFGISTDIISARDLRNGNYEQAQKAEVVREVGYASKFISGTMLGLLLLTGGLEKLTESIKVKRKKN